MSIATDRERLIGDIIRLRQAERVSPKVEDISAVRTDLERMVGPTVSRALSARMLGVSQTALDRWIAQGDVAVVITPTGRVEIPLHHLIDVVAAVEERRQIGSDRHPLAAVLQRRRREARRLMARSILPSQNRPSRPHSDVELRSLAYHRVVAQQLSSELVREAVHRLRRWKAEGQIDPNYAEQWEEVLALPLSRARKEIARDTTRMCELRQSSPFAGTLSESARRRVLATVESAA